MPRARLRSAVLSLVIMGSALCVADAAVAQSSATAAMRDSAVVAAERSIWDNIVAGRWNGATDILGGALTVDAKGVYVWSAANTDALRTATAACLISGVAMRDVQTREVAPDVVGLGYRADISLKCASATPAMVNNYLSVYRRRGTAWELVVTSITRAGPPR